VFVAAATRDLTMLCIALIPVAKLPQQVGAKVFHVKHVVHFLFLLSNCSRQIYLGILGNKRLEFE
jgi:hypothetical protein